MESRALGKGLSALIPEKTDSAQASGIMMLKVTLVDDSSFQPRTNYADDKQSELMSSIKERGVLQPILVRKKGNRFEVVAGERRLRAARTLKLEEIPVIVKEVSDQEALVLALIENIQREELNPIEEAKAFRRLIDEFQFTQDSVAQSVGKDRSTVSNLLRLLKLPDFIQKHVFDGKLSEGHARTLLAIDSVEIQKKTCELIIRNGLSVRELENLIKQGQYGSKPRREKSRPSSASGQVAELEGQLQKILGTKVRILAQKKRGKIVIEYYSTDDLKRILQIFHK